LPCNPIRAAAAAAAGVVVVDNGDDRSPITGRAIARTLISLRAILFLARDVTE